MGKLRKQENNSYTYALITMALGILLRGISWLISRSKELGILGFFCGFVLPLTLIFMFWDICKRSKRKKIDMIIPETKAWISHYNSLLNEINEQVDSLFKQFPQGYNTPDSVEYMMSALKQHRAEGYADAAAMYDEYSHRRSMENLEARQLEEQRKQTNMQTALVAMQTVQTVSQLKFHHDIKKSLQ